MHLSQFAIFETNKVEQSTDKVYRNWRSLDEQAFIDDFKNINWERVLQLENVCNECFYIHTYIFRWTRLWSNFSDSLHRRGPL